MGNKMLIDAAHPEETRVVVLRGNRIEEFDFEAASKRQLRGNIYLAKVTRVEPSLQAAFIEYGGNRHGFLAFSEIHPDYYQIPVADRQQLLEDEARSAEEDEEEPRGGQGGNGGNGGGHRRSRRHRRSGRDSAERRAPNSDETIASEADVLLEGEASDPVTEAELPFSDASETVGTAFLQTGQQETSLVTAADADDDQPAWTSPLDDQGAAEAIEAPSMDGGAMDLERGEGAPEDVGASDESAISPVELREAPQPLPDLPETQPQEAEPHESEPQEAEPHETEPHETEPHDAEGHEEEVVEQLGGDALEDVPQRFSRPRRNYKIQEVIKRRQVLLVQVVKEERGNKGAALTTYLSLAGRYSVLMPNTARGGGISRKIVDPEDRKRLKAIAQELEVPDGMGIILRTAGASRSMPEVRRDFEYLMRMWETVRETTLKSTAPTLVYEEGSLIKRSIRDLFTKDVDEVVVAGEEAYREAKEFMRLLMPNQVRSVVPWRESQPLFAKAGAEAQLDAMFSSQVVLKSGGYLVINQTEALVAIDVNSGRSTREHNIEDTALRTNLEAADEIARQLRLRDLAGLIVVDFIDMEEGRNDRAVERRLKDALKNDRARIQIGRISHFGLLEMSRQRMRTGVLEGSTVMCPHCAGSGTVRSVSSIALHVLRLLEDTLIRSAATNLVARTRAEVALYVLNQKRANLLDLEARFGVAITVIADPAMTGMVYHAIERGAEATPPQFLPFRAEPLPETDRDAVDEEVEDGLGETSDEMVEETELEAAAPDGRPRDEAARQAIGEGEGGRRRRRRRRRRGKDGQAEGSREASGTEPLEGAEDGLTDEEVAAEGEDLTDLEAGVLSEEGAPSPQRMPEAMLAEPAEAASPTDEGRAALADEPVLRPAEETAPEADIEAPRRRRTSRRTTRSTAEVMPAEAVAGEAEATVEDVAAPPRRARRPRSKVAAEPAPETVDEAPQPSADRDIEADTAQQHAEPETSPEPQLPLIAAAPAAPAPAEPAPVPEPDPDRPKRSGWWQRAKATFSAGS